MMAYSARDVAIDPEWLPHTFDEEGRNLVFVQVPREARQGLLFLTDEYYDGHFPKTAVSADEVALAIESAETAPIHFIFHTSFCCSTLLARALDVPSAATVLREPVVLYNLANRLIETDNSANRKRLELTVSLLERPLASGETVVVKPSNFSNRLVDPLLRMRPKSRAVLLYSDLESFMRSSLMRGLWGRVVGRKLYNHISGWSRLRFGYNNSELLEQTDVQIAALAWLMQIHHFDTIAKTFGQDRVMVLDSAELLAEPALKLAEAQAFLGLNFDDKLVRKIAEGPAFSKHSKLSDRDYDVEQRRLDHESVIETHREELSMVAQWIQVVAKAVGAPLRPDYRNSAASAAA